MRDGALEKSERREETERHRETRVTDKHADKRTATQTDRDGNISLFRDGGQLALTY